MIWPKVWIRIALYYKMHQLCAHLICNAHTTLYRRTLAIACKPLTLPLALLPILICSLNSRSFLCDFHLRCNENYDFYFYFYVFFFVCSLRERFHLMWEKERERDLMRYLFFNRARFMNQLWLMFDAGERQHQNCCTHTHVPADCK